MLKDEFKKWMQNPANCPTLKRAETPDIYIMYLNGMFVMLQENGFLPFDGWAVLNNISPIKSNKPKLEKIAWLIGEAIKDAEKSSKIIKSALKNFKSAFSKLNEYIQSI